MVLNERGRTHLSCQAGRTPGPVAALTGRGKAVYVLTNGATFDESAALEKYRRLGFAFEPQQIVSSRALLHGALSKFPDRFHWGVAAAPQSNLEALPGDLRLLADDRAAYEEADGFVLLSSLFWNMARQDLLVASLSDKPRPVLVGNPDLVERWQNGVALSRFDLATLYTPGAEGYTSYPRG